MQVGQAGAFVVPEQLTAAGLEGADQLAAVLIVACRAEVRREARIGNLAALDGVAVDVSAVNSGVPTLVDAAESDTISLVERDLAIPKYAAGSGSALERAVRARRAR